MKKSLFLVLSFLLSAGMAAQDGASAYMVLGLPVSPRTAALGGENISTIEDTPWAGWSNPALYSSVSDRSLGLDFMTWAGGGSWTGAQFVKAFGERHTAAFSAQYMGYGSMDETDDTGAVLGTFTPKDIVAGGAYSYLLTDRWAGGAAFKMVSSNYAGYHAFAFAVDLGVNYYDEERDLSLSAALRNVGAELKSFDGHTASVPFNFQLGLTKGMSHLPVRLNLTLTDLTRWGSHDYFRPDGEKLSFGRKALNHVVVGVDVMPTPILSLSAGYNFRRAYELKAAGSGHGAGLTFGAGLHLARFGLGLSYARYHVAASSFLASVVYRF